MIFSQHKKPAVPSNETAGLLLIVCKISSSYWEKSIITAKADITSGIIPPPDNRHHQEDVVLPFHKHP